MWSNLKLSKACDLAVFEILNLKNKKISNLQSQISNSLGQSLLEVVIVIAVGLIVVSALVFATISGLRNAQFAKNQAVATKLAQEGLERVKGMRDRNDNISFAGLNPATPNQSTYKFNDLWNYSMSDVKCSALTPPACTFTFSSDVLTRGSGFEPDDSGQFSRQILISDNPTSFQKEKTVTAIVKWSDFSGEHESKLTTILSKL